MSTDVMTVAEDASLKDAIRLMERHHIKRLPVVKSSAMVGIFTRADILRAFIVGSPKPLAASVSDGAIREQLIAGEANLALQLQISFQMSLLRSGLMGASPE